MLTDGIRVLLLTSAAVLCSTTSGVLGCAATTSLLVSNNCAPIFGPARRKPSTRRVGHFSEVILGLTAITCLIVQAVRATWAGSSVGDDAWNLIGPADPSTPAGAVAAISAGVLIIAVPAWYATDRIRAARAKLGLLRHHEQRHPASGLAFISALLVVLAAGAAVSQPTLIASPLMLATVYSIIPSLWPAKSTNPRFRKSIKIDEYPLLQPSVLILLRWYTGFAILGGWVIQLLSRGSATDLNVVRLGYLRHFGNPASFQYHVSYICAALFHIVAAHASYRLSVFSKDQYVLDGAYTQQQLHGDGSDAAEFKQPLVSSPRTPTAASAAAADGDKAPLPDADVPDAGSINSANDNTPSQLVASATNGLHGIASWYGSRIGLGLVCVAFLALAITFPSVAAAIPALGVLIAALLPAASSPLYRRPATASPFIALCSIWLCLQLLSVYSGSLAAAWMHPQYFEPGSSSYTPTPMSDPAVGTSYPQWTTILGLMPLSNPGAQCWLLMLVILMGAGYQLAASSGSYKQVADASTFGTPDADRTDTVLSSLVDLLHAIGSGYASWATLILLYVLGLSHVDLLHAGYVLAFASFTASAKARRKYWRWLVAYAAFVVTVVYVWRMVAVYAPSSWIDAVPPWVLSADVADPSKSLWVTSFTGNVAILVFAVLQTPLYDAESGVLHTAHLLELFRRHSWMRVWSARFRTLQLTAGIWVAYLALFLIAIVPPFDLTSAITILITMITAARHLGLGVSSSISSPSTMLSLTRLFRVQAIAQGTFLTARYLYQFGALSDAFDSAWAPFASVITVSELGLSAYIDRGSYSGNVYLHLLDAVAMLMIAVLIMRALDGEIDARKHGLSTVTADENAAVAEEGEVIGDSSAVAVDAHAGSAHEHSSDAAGTAVSSSSDNPIPQPPPPLRHAHKPGATEASAASLLALIVCCIALGAGASAGAGAGIGTGVLIGLVVSAAIIADVSLHGRRDLWERWSRLGVAWLTGLERIARHGAFHHSGKLLAIVGAAIALARTDAIGIIYLVIVIVHTCLMPVGAAARQRDRPASARAHSSSSARLLGLGASDADVSSATGTSRIAPLRNLWIPLLGLAFVDTVLRYAYQFSFFEFSRGHWYSGGSDASEWWGFPRLDHRSSDPPGYVRSINYGDVWSLLAGQATVVLFCVLQRWSHDFKDGVEQDKAHAAEVMRQGYVDAALELDLIFPRSAPIPSAVQLLEAQLGTHGVHKNDADGAGHSAAQSHSWRASRTANGSNTKSDENAHRSIVLGILKARSRMTVAQGLEKLVRQCSAHLLRDATLFALVVAAFATLDAWACLYLLFVPVLLLPFWGSRRQQAASFQHGHHQKQDSPHPSRLPHINTRLWVGLSALLVCSILIHQLAAMGWHPDTLDWWIPSHWPWSANAPTRYWLGIGLRGYTLHLLPAYVALLFSMLTMREHALYMLKMEHAIADSALRCALLPEQSGSSRALDFGTTSADQTTAAVDADNDNAWPGVQLNGAAPGANGNSRMRVADNSEYRCTWDALQVWVAKHSTSIVMVVLFTLSALQVNQDLLSAAYFLFALRFLYRPDALSHHHNRVFAYLRIYNLCVIFIQIMYQMPFIPSPGNSACDFYDAGSCFSWQTLFGLGKVQAVPVDGWPGCDPDAGGCNSPFSLTSGLLPSLLVFILATIQAHIFDSKAYAFVQQQRASEDLHARQKAATAQQLNTQNRQRQVEQEKQESRQLRARLARLVHRVARWEAIASASASGRPAPSTVQSPLGDGTGRDAGLAGGTQLLPAAADDVFPPDPPSGVAAIQVGHQIVRVTWDDQRPRPAVPAPGSEAVSYVISANEVGSTMFGDWIVVARALTAVSRHVDVTHGLTLGKTYEFRVAAESAAGRGYPSIASAPVTIAASGWQEAADRALPDSSSSTTPSSQIADAGQVSAAPATSSSSLDRLASDGAGSLSAHERQSLLGSEKASATSERRQSLADQISSMAHHAVSGASDAARGVASVTSSAAGAVNRYAMAGAADVEHCCGCEAGFPGWVDWVISCVEGGLDSTVDKVMHPDPTARFRGMMGSKGGSDDSVQTPHLSTFAPGDAAAGTATSFSDLHEHKAEAASTAASRIKPKALWMRFLFMCYLAYLGLLSHTEVIVGAAILLAVCIHASALSVLLITVLFLHLSVDWPRASTQAWDWCIKYVLCVIALQFVFQLPLLCMRLSSADMWMPGLWFQCDPTAINAATANKYVQPMALFGVLKLSSEYGGPGFLAGVAPDLLVLCALLLHRSTMRTRGLWHDGDGGSSVLGGKPGAGEDGIAARPSAASTCWHRIKAAFVGDPIRSDRLMADALRAGDLDEAESHGSDEYHALPSDELAARRGNGESKTLPPSSPSLSVGAPTASVAKPGQTGFTWARVAFEPRPPVHLGIAGGSAEYDGSAEYQQEQRTVHGADATDDKVLDEEATPYASIDPNAILGAGEGAALGMSDTKHDDDGDAVDGYPPDAIGASRRRHVTSAAASHFPGQQPAATSMNSDFFNGIADLGESKDKSQNVRKRSSKAVVLDAAADTAVTSVSKDSFLSPHSTTGAKTSTPSSTLVMLLRRVLPEPLSASLEKTLQPRLYAKDKHGRDLYIWTFLLQFLLLLYTICAYAAFSAPEAESTGVGEQLQYNQFSGEMVLAVIAIVLVMVADRVAYILRSHALKLGLHLITVLAVHVAVFFALPVTTDRPFTNNGTLVVFYLIWCIYFALSALQLWCGYARSPPRDSLKNAGYNPPIPLLFSLYLSVPFLAELRNILDWCCTTTSLDIYQWLKWTSIHTDLFLAQCTAVSRTRNRETTTGHKAQPATYKFWCGILLFVALLLVILLPALMFSTLNPALSYNSITGASASLSVGTSSGSFTLWSTSHYAAIYSANSVPGYPNYFNDLRNNATVQGVPSPIRPDWAALTQQVSLYPFPSSTWQLSPPALSSLLTDLQECAALPADADTDVSVTMSYSFNRPGPPGFETASGRGTVMLDQLACSVLVDAIQQAPTSRQHAALRRSSTKNRNHQRRASASTAAEQPAPITSPQLSAAEPLGQPLTLVDLYPLAVRLPATASAVSLGVASRSLDLQLYAGNSTGSADALQRSLWWTVTISDADPFGPSPSTNGPDFNTVSDRVAPTALVSSLGAGSYSVLAVYFGVVLAVGRLIRTGFGSPTHRIAFEELPDATELLELCEGIRVTQAARYPGHLVDESRLWRVLISLMRSPEILFRITRKRKAD